MQHCMVPLCNCQFLTLLPHVCHYKYVSSINKPIQTEWSNFIMNWKKKHLTTEDFPSEKHVQPLRHNFIHNCKVRGTQTSGIHSQKSYSKLIRIIIMLECISLEEAKQFVRHPDVLQIPSVTYANRNPLRGIPAQESDSVLH